MKKKIICDIGLNASRDRKLPTRIINIDVVTAVKEENLEEANILLDSLEEAITQWAFSQGFGGYESSRIVDNYQE